MTMRGGSGDLKNVLSAEIPDDDMPLAIVRERQRSSDPVSGNLTDPVGSSSCPVLDSAVLSQVRELIVRDIINLQAA